MNAKRVGKLIEVMSGMTEEEINYAVKATIALLEESEAPDFEGIDADCGKIDIDIVTSGATQAMKVADDICRKIIKDELNKGVDMVPVAGVVSIAMGKGMDEARIISTLERLERNGDIYKPRRDFVKLTAQVN